MQPRKLLYVFYIPLLLTEWAVDLIAKIWNAIHNSVKELTLVVESTINEPTKSKPPAKG